MFYVPLAGLLGCAAFATYLIRTSLRRLKGRDECTYRLPSCRTALDVANSSEALSLVIKMAHPKLSTDALADRLAACYKRFPPPTAAVSAMREETRRLEGSGGEMEFAAATVYSSMLSSATAASPPPAWPTIPSPRPRKARPTHPRPAAHGSASDC